mgnify:CR=1 FL=1
MGMMAMEPQAAMGPQASPQAPQATNGLPESDQELLDLIRQALMKMINNVDDEIETATLTKILALIQGIPAGRQKQDEAALGATPALKSLRRNVGGGY